MVNFTGFCNLKEENNKFQNEVNTLRSEKFDVTQLEEEKRQIKEKTNIICYGGADGEIDVTVIGGMAPYTYEWSNGSNAEVTVF